MEPNVTITPEQVDAIFAAAETQSDYVFNLYKLVVIARGARSCATKT